MIVLVVITSQTENTNCSLYLLSSCDMSFGGGGNRPVSYNIKEQSYPAKKYNLIESWCMG